MSGIDLKFTFYSKIFLSLQSVYGEVHVSIHACLNNYLRCTIVYANGLWSFYEVHEKMYTNISNSWSPAQVCFFLNNRVFFKQQGFYYWGMEKVPPPLAKNSVSLPPEKVSPVDSPDQIFIPTTKGSFVPNPLNSTFLLKIFFLRVVSWHQKCIDL